jgi:hypothetical protein
MRQLPPFVEKMLVQPLILLDEDRADFGVLFETIWDGECPQTFAEKTIVADIAYAEWEIFRLRGLKVRALHTALLRALQNDLNSGPVRFIDATKREPPKWHSEFRRAVIDALAGVAAAKSALAKFLRRDGLTLESLVASTFVQTISTQSSADRLVDAAYKRRSALYADLERVRAKARRRDDLPAKAVESPSVAPSNEPVSAQTEAGADVVDDGAGSRPSSPEERHS